MAPQAASNLMVKVEDLKGRTDEQFALELLGQTGVLVVHGSGFGTHPSEGYLRLVYLADEATLNQAFDGIASVLPRPSSQATPKTSQQDAALQI